MAGKAYQIYRASTLGETLAESLTELERKYPMLTEEIKERIMSQFDVTITNALGELTSRAMIRSNAKEVHVWEWRDTVNGAWVRYPPDVQARLEDTFLRYGATKPVRIITQVDTFVVTFDGSDEGSHSQRCVRTATDAPVRRSPKGLLPVYRCVDHTWTFVLKDAEIETDPPGSIIQVPFLKIVACDSANLRG